MNSETSIYSTPHGTVLVTGLLVVVGAVLLFLSARSLAWSTGWTFGGLFGLNLMMSLICVAIWNPALIKHRSRFGTGTKTWDLVWLSITTLLLGWIFVAANYADTVTSIADSPPLVWVIGACIHTCGWLLVSWCQTVNPFFEKTVRIQAERNHHVVDSGPYRFVRHPGYVGFCAMLLSVPLLLGSPATLTPILLLFAGLIVRTALEDRMLCTELTGYGEYADRVRFRLLPGVW